MKVQFDQSNTWNLMYGLYAVYKSLDIVTCFTNGGSTNITDAL